MNRLNTLLPEEPKTNRLESLNLNIPIQESEINWLSDPDYMDERNNEIAEIYEQTDLSLDDSISLVTNYIPSAPQMQIPDPQGLVDAPEYEGVKLVEGRAQQLIDRFGERFMNAFAQIGQKIISSPISPIGIPKRESEPFMEQARAELKSSGFKGSFAQSEQMARARADRLAAAKRIPTWEVPQAETKTEKAVDVAAGLTSFITKLALLRQIAPAGTPDVIIWETENLLSDGIPGEGAAMALTLGAINKIPAKTILRKSGKVSLQSGLFATMTAVQGGGVEDILISAAIPPALAGTRAFKRVLFGAKVYDQYINQHISAEEHRVKARNVARQEIYNALKNKDANPVEWERVMTKYSGWATVGEKVNTPPKNIGNLKDFGKYPIAKAIDSPGQEMFVYKPPEAPVKAERIEGTKPPVEPTSPEIAPKADEIEGAGEVSAKEGEIVYHQSDTGQLKLGKDVMGLGEGYFVSKKPLPKGFYGKKDVTLRLSPDTKLFDLQAYAKKEGVNLLKMSVDQRQEFIEEGLQEAKLAGYDGLEIQPDDIWMFDKSKLILQPTPQTPAKEKQPWEMTKEEYKQEELYNQSKSLSEGESKVLSDGRVMVKASDSMNWGNVYVTHGMVDVANLEPRENLGDREDKVEEYKLEGSVEKAPPILISPPLIDEKTGEIFYNIEDGHHRYMQAVDSGVKQLPTMMRIPTPRNAIEYREAEIKLAVKQNKPVPREVLEEYKGKKWADEALVKQPAPPVKESMTTEKKKAKTVPLPEIASGGVPEPPPGLTKAEVEFLGRREQNALRTAQKLGYPVGYKMGYRQAALKGKRMIGKMRMDLLVSEKSKKDAKQLIDFFVPKEERARYTKRLLDVKTPKDVEKITNQILKFVEDYEHRNAIKDFKKFIKQVRKDYSRGENKFAKLPANIRKRFEQITKDYDLAKLSDDKKEDLVKHKEFIQKIAGTVAEAFRNYEELDEKGIDVLQLPNRRVLDLERLEKVHIGQLSTENIQYIQDELQSLITIEQRKQEIRDAIRSEYAHTYVTKANNEVYDRGVTKKGEVKKAGLITKGVDIEQANLRTLVKQITGKDAEATEEFLVNRIWEQLRQRDAFNKEWEIVATEGFKNLGLGDKFLKDLDAELEITWGGKKKTVPNWVLMNTYMDAEADGNLKRLLNNRTHSFTNDKGNTVYLGKLSLGELQDIVKNLPQEFKDAADFMFEHNRKYNAPAINKTSLQERGYPIAIYEKYHSYPRRISKLPAGQKTEIALAAANRGRYQQRTGGNEEHIITNPVVQFYSNMQQDADYAAMELVRQDAKALLGDRKWRKNMERSGNKEYVDAIIKIYQRSEGLISDIDIGGYLAGKLLSTFGKGTLSLRPSGAVIQTASVPAAYPVIERRYFNATYIPKPSETKSLMDKYPTLWKRWNHRNYDFVIGVSSVDDRIRQMITGKRPVKDALMNHYTWGDQWAILKIYDAAQNKLKSETEFAEGSKEYEKELENLFFRAMESQPQWDTWHRTLSTTVPERTLGGAMQRSFALFMSARIQQWNVILQALDDYKKGRITNYQKYKRLGNISEANLKVAIYRNLVRKMIAYSVAGTLIALGLKDEEDVKENLIKDLKSDPEQIITNWFENMGGLYVYGNLITFLGKQAVKSLEGKPVITELNQTRTGSVLTDFYLDAQNISIESAKFGRELWMDILGEEDAYYKSGQRKGEPKWKTTGLSLIDDAAEMLSQLTGYGYSGIRSDIVWPVEQALQTEEENQITHDITRR